jgi:hypothetical protein
MMKVTGPPNIDLAPAPAPAPDKETEAVLAPTPAGIMMRLSNSHNNYHKIMIYKMRHCRFELLQQSKSDTYVYLSGSNF